MHRIRPHQLFNLVDSSSYENRMVRIVLPEQRTPVLLETAVLLALSKLVRPTTFLEVGTFLGIETLNMAANLPADSRVYTLDLEKDSLKTVEQEEHDRSLTAIHMGMQDKLAFLGSSVENKITRLYGDSKTFDFSPFHKRMDMIYVDGGHDLRTLTSDTQNAFDLLSEDHATCIVWHDFANPKHPAVGPYLLELSKSKELFHVQETMMVFHLGNAAELAERLKR
jgi:Methyltransferase domain